MGRSEVRRPYLISVDGDILAGTSIIITVEGNFVAGMPWRSEYINPKRAQLPAPRFEGLGIKLALTPSSLATPFLYAIIVEGDEHKWSYDAEALARVLNLSELGWVLMTPNSGRPYITSAVVSGSQVFASDVTRPWIFEIEGHVAPGASLLLPISGITPDGLRWDQELSGPGRHVLPECDNPHWQIGLSMAPTPDGVESPQLTGIAIEGDGRRYHMSAAEFARGLDMSGLRLIELSETESILMLDWIPIPFAGQPPSILAHLHELFAHNKLRPGVQYFDE